MSVSNFIDESVDQIIGLMVYDKGFVNSGIKDDLLKQSFKELPADQLGILLSECVRRLAGHPYLFEDVVVFVNWVRDDDGLGIKF